MISIVIPARNEPYLSRTIQDLLVKAKGDIEIIAILDGYWEKPDRIIDDPCVNYIHFTNPRGMRNAINSGVAIAKGEYILKIDAHCMVAPGYDEILADDCKDNWIVVPRRYALDVANWQIENRSDNKYPIDYEYLDYSDLHGIVWIEKRDERKDIMIDDIISAQGSAWFIRKDFFDRLEGLDDINYGTFFLEFQELSFKAWTEGGRVVVNKNTWYAHWHKTDGRGYSLGSKEREKAIQHMQTWRANEKWQEVIKKFQPMPTWKT